MRVIATLDTGELLVVMQREEMSVSRERRSGRMSEDMATYRAFFSRLNVKSRARRLLWGVIDYPYKSSLFDRLTKVNGERVSVNEFAAMAADGDLDVELLAIPGLGWNSLIDIKKACKGYLNERQSNDDNSESHPARPDTVHPTELADQRL